MNARDHRHLVTVVVVTVVVFAVLVVALTLLILAILCPTPRPFKGPLPPPSGLCDGTWGLGLGELGGVDVGDGAGAVAVASKCSWASVESSIMARV
jgi:hypothetical protein